jgi:lactoylglutathione lyase
MISKVSTALLYVSDQDRSLDFYTQALGFVKHTDSEMWPGARWLEVVPPGAETTVTLAAAKDFEKTPVEDSSTLNFATPNARELYDELRAKDVDVTEPVTEPWGTYVRVTDPDGHTFLVSEGD